MCVLPHALYKPTFFQLSIATNLSFNQIQGVIIVFLCAVSDNTWSLSTCLLLEKEKSNFESPCILLIVKSMQSLYLPYSFIQPPEYFQLENVGQPARDQEIHVRCISAICRYDITVDNLY